MSPEFTITPEEVRADLLSSKSYGLNLTHERLEEMRQAYLGTSSQQPQPAETSGEIPQSVG